MRAPERRERRTKLLDLICELIEQPQSKISSSILESHDSAADCLIEIGLLRPATVPSTIACRACDEDHAATPEFDSVARRYFHFCPIAGRVEVNPRDLEIFEICARAMVDLLAAAFPVLPAVGRELVAGTAWHLGETIVGGTSLTVIFACRIRSQRAFSALARAVATVSATELGLIVTSGPLPDSQPLLPNRYTVASLRDIASANGSRIEINRDRIAAHIRMLPGNQARLRARGRSSDQDRVLDAYHRRRQRGEPFVSIAAEARAIVSELTKTHPDRTPPGVSTVRRHLGRLRALTARIDQN
jgi:hypothetical protein